MRGISEFLSETCLHGFKYLGPEQGTVARITWGFILTTTTAVCVLLIHDGFVDWQENPVLVSVESFDYPLSEIRFPAVTICPDEKNVPDYWALTEIVLNMLDLDCKINRTHLCPGNMEIRNDFIDLFNLLDETVTDWIEVKSLKLTDGSEIESLLLEDGKYLWLLYHGLSNGSVTFPMLDDKLFQSIATFTRSISFFNQYLDKTLFTNEENQIPPSKELIDKLKMFYRKVALVALEGKFDLGTEIRQWSQYLGKTFEPGLSEEINQITCDLLRTTENSLHSIMKALGNEFGMNFSLHDIPNMFRTKIRSLWTHEMKQNHAIYSFCECHKAYDFYASFYDDIESDDEEKKNPLCDKEIPLVEKTKANISTILKAMKFAHHVWDTNDAKLIHGLVTKLFPSYAIKPLSTTLENAIETMRRLHVRGYSVDIYGGRKLIPPQNVLTSKGLCQAWNSKTMTEVFKDSSVFMTAFGQTFPSKISEHLTASWPEMEFHIDLQNSYLTDRKEYVDYYWFKINTEEAFFDMFKPSLIRQGFKTYITIKPTLVASDEGTKNGLSPHERGCLFPSEDLQEDSFLKNYSRSGCLFECMVKHSHKKMQCSPWNIISTNETLPICDFEQNAQFWKEINDFGYMEKSCSCPSNCNDIKYSFTEKQMPLTLEDVFIFGEDGWDYKCLTPNLFKIEKVKGKEGAIDLNDDHFYDDYECLQDDDKENILNKEIAIISVKMDGQSMIKYKKGLRVTFLDKLGSIGGTLGLFSGFSLLAIAEIIHWLLKIIYQITR